VVSRLRLAAGLALLLAACGGQAAPASSSAGSAAAKPAQSAAASTGGGSAAAKPSDWNALVDAAKKEGSVSVWGTPGTPYRQVLVTEFEKAFPGITVEGVFVPAAERTSRINLERQAGKYTVDVWASPGAQVTDFKKNNIIVPLKPQLILPEVTDENAWFQGHLWWTDTQEPLSWSLPIGSVIPMVFINTKMVNPSEFTSYKDLLDPKWKGKMAATDIRNSGPGVAPSRMLFKELGADYIKQLFGQTSLKLSADQRQLIDWVSQGTYPVGLFIDPGEVTVAIKQGLPIAPVPPEQFKEGAPVGPNNGGVTIIDKAPHPNAAKLYVNWMLSKEGQAIWQREVGDNSLRVDIPKDGVNPLFVLKPGGNYTMVGGEEMFTAYNTALYKQTIDAALGAS
jgi:iron(III) transport system substrate-binding protein